MIWLAWVLGGLLLALGILRGIGTIIRIRLCVQLESLERASRSGGWFRKADEARALREELERRSWLLRRASKRTKEHA